MKWTSIFGNPESREARKRRKLVKKLAKANRGIRFWTWEEDDCIYAELDTLDNMVLPKKCQYITNIDTQEVEIEYRLTKFKILADGEDYYG